MCLRFSEAIVSGLIDTIIHLGDERKRIHQKEETAGRTLFKTQMKAHG